MKGALETYDIDVPRWIDRSYICDDDAETLASFLSDLSVHGCASGMYMPAVTYYEAERAMHEHADERGGILDYLDDAGLNLSELVRDQESWAGLAVACVSQAVELWADWALADLRRAWDEDEDEDE